MNSDAVLNDRYRLISQLGSGGMGSVWLAHDELLDRRVALKELLHRSGIDLGESRKRALREARAMARLNHPSIVRIHDVFLVGRDPWIVMEHIKGRSLDKILQDGPLDELAIARIALPVLDGLGSVHGVGMVHRDVKPGNILVSSDKSVFLVDFGIARVDGDTQITAHARMLGTVEFMAPERLMNRQVGPPSDLWSLGVTLFCALEGYSPFLRRGTEGQEATMLAILHDAPPRPRSTGSLASVVLRLLRKDPGRRASAAELAEVLGNILRASTTPKREPASERKQRQPVAPHEVTVPASRSRTTQARPHQEDVREAARKAGSDDVVAMLLTRPKENAAQILAALRPREAGAAVQAMAATKPQMAGALLTMLTLSAAGHILDYVSPPATAAILEPMSARDAAHLLNRTDPRTAAEVIMELPAAKAARLLTMMQDRRPVVVLGYVRPSTIAAVFDVSDDLKDRLFGQLSPAVQTQVRRYTRLGRASDR